MKLLYTILGRYRRISMCVLVLLYIWVSPLGVLAQEPQNVVQESVAATPPAMSKSRQKADDKLASMKQRMDSLQSEDLIDTTFVAVDSMGVSHKVFNPDGMRAVWLSALMPGLGQIYNRRYWKLPIVVGGFMGLVYATSWNGRMYADYQQAYLDVMDTDPNTNSYMDFFPPYYTEDNIDKTWLTNILKTRKDSYRHYRDYCIVGMVALYLVCILDAYVDAELYHFDMSPDLAVEVKPAIIPVTSSIQHTALGLQCAITF